MSTDPRSPGANPNERIYDRNYSVSQLELSTTPWDRDLVAIRMGLIRRYGEGKDVVDLCCGSGSYLLPNLDRFRSAVAVDFSEAMLQGLRDRVTPGRPNLEIVKNDVQELSLAGESCDFVWSFTSLYYVPALEKTLSHVARILRPGGIAALELGNRTSLNAIVARVQHEDAGSAKQFLRPYGELRRLITDSGLQVRDWRSFQLLTMYGAPRRLVWLSPLLSSRWKRPLSMHVAGRMLDERLSSAPGLRRLAFRHLLIAEKP